MTRINVIPARDLTDQHLFAEWRELPRVWSYATGAPAPVDTYRLGKGHVLFFRDKTAYLAKRHAELTAELLDRGYQLSKREPLLPVPGADLDWLPDIVAIETNVARLIERVRHGKGRHTYYGKGVSAAWYEGLCCRR